MNTHCSNCGNFCPSGTLDSGLCNYCELIGKQIPVRWGHFGIQTCLVMFVSKTCTVYASRWNTKRKRYTTPRPVRYYNEWIRK